MDNAKQELQWLTASTATGSPVTFDTGAIDQVLWAFRRRQATLAHDKIYALLELSNWAGQITHNPTAESNISSGSHWIYP